MDKKSIKEILGEIPFAVELYWLLRQRGKQLKSRYSLKALQAALPDIIDQVRPFAEKAARDGAQEMGAQEVRGGGKHIFIFANLHYWIEHAALLGLALAGQGHKVTLAYLPYSEWNKPISRFDLRRQNIYTRQVLQEATPLLKIVSLLDINPIFQQVPPEVAAMVDQVSLFDSQYTLQVERVGKNHPFYQMRHERNHAAARATLNWFQNHRPDVVVVPNGTILEFGIVYNTARHLNIPAVTYEFGDQRERIWLAQNSQIMRQETDSLWEARREQPLTAVEFDRLRSLFVARQRAALWENFSRTWQGTPTQGGGRVRTALDLDGRPVVVLATNVLGDSLTLGRNIFSQGMEDWITRTVHYFAEKPEVQLVIRIHPGETLTRGPSMADVVEKALPDLPAHFRLVKANDKINTYDLVEIADAGLVYTTTIGMEMAMNSIPVVVAGETHYRGRGFTTDPSTWEEFFDQLDKLVAGPREQRLLPARSELAWQYAYRFFFEFPLAFPWHLVYAWEDYKARSMKYVLGPEGQARYGQTFRYLTGEPIDWTPKG
jgi:hypothetical protein